MKILDKIWEINNVIEQNNISRDTWHILYNLKQKKTKNTENYDTKQNEKKS